MQTVPIADIVVVQRKRRLDDAKVRQLADSIAEVGLLNPVTISESKVLRAGWHRLEACKLLGYATIQVTVMTGSDLHGELAEIDENLVRNELNPLEQGEHLVRRDEILTALGVRAESGTNLVNRTGEIDSPVPKTTADIAAEVGLTERTAQQRKQVARAIAEEAKDIIRDTVVADSQTELLKLARLDEEQQVAVAEKLASGEAKSVAQAVRTLDRADAPPIPDGVFSVLYADPPWEYNNSGLGGSAASHYPTIATTDLCAMSVAERIADNAVLFLWVTNPLLVDGLAVLSAWGFDYKTNFVWVKDRDCYGRLGFYNYGRHELLLVGVRGSYLPADGSLVSSLIEAQKREHSRKPDDVYSIIEAMYPNGSKLELFARTQREGWVAWGNEVGKWH